MFECFPYDPDHFTCFVDATRIRIAAKRIAELYAKKNPWNECHVFGCGCNDCYSAEFMDRLNPVKEALQRMDYSEDIGYQKMQSHGDEPV